jgi:hypothetical protein
MPLKQDTKITKSTQKEQTTQTFWHLEYETADERKPTQKICAKSIFFFMNEI